MEEDTYISVQFKNFATGELTGRSNEMLRSSTVELLTKMCNIVLEKEKPVPFLFFVGDKQITQNLLTVIGDGDGCEKFIEVSYAEQSIFKVRPITRCTSSLPGHAEAVISASFSPDGRYLASGSGDTTVRLWDVNTETPQYTCKGHKHWVLCIAWSPNGMKLASGCKNGQICIWDPVTGRQLGKTLTGHSGWIYSICWEPLHLNEECRHIASASKDYTVRVWDIITYQTLYVLSSHTASVTCVKWGGSGLIYSSSQDRSIRVWRAQDGAICRTLQGHGHWINTLALNTDYVLRTGPYDPSSASHVYREVTETAQQLSRLALQRYKNLMRGQPEILISGSDDFTMFMWKPETEKKPICRMTGHSNLINDVKFSPDMRLVASASFDKSVKIWQGRNGKYVGTLHGHVQRVYQVAWSADSRLLVSSSADSTLKVWNMENCKIMIDLPGHADEVYAVDWSPDGQRVVSGGKDKVIKVWRK